MRIPRRRRPTLEPIIPQGPASFALRRFRSRCFPFEWHYHPEVELTLIVRGAGLRFVGDSIEPYHAGDLVLIGPDLPHTWHSPEDTREGDAVESIVAQFPRGLFGETMERLPEWAPIRRLFDIARQGVVITGGARDRAEAMLHEASKAPSGSLSRMMGLLESLRAIAEQPDHVTPLSRTVHHGAGEDPAGARKLKHVIEHVHASVNEDEPISQAEAAASVGMSPAVFSRFFRRRVGQTYVRYVNEWRVGLACRKLVETRDNIIDIAFSCGFDNLSNFNRRFRQIRGMTPREFRKLAGT